MIKFVNVSKQFDSSHNNPTFTISALNFEIPEHEMWVILGSSGSGKTTCLKMMNRQIEPSNGKIIFNGKDIKQHDIFSLRRSMGYVFQDIGLFPHLTVGENISLILKLNGHSKSECEKRIYETLEFVQLDPKQYAARFPHELSGGQQQRVGVARAIAHQPKLILLDEPFGAIDSITRDQLQKDFIKLKKELRLTAVMVTHDVLEAMRLADKIMVMDQGKILAIGTPQQLLEPTQHPFVKALFAKPLQQFSAWLTAKNATTNKIINIDNEYGV